MNVVNKSKYECCPDRIKALVFATDCVESQLADAIGISKSSLMNYCSGRTVPGLDALLKIADYFGVSMDYLLGRTEEKDISKDYKIMWNDMKKRAYEDYLLSTSPNEIAKRSIKIPKGFEAPWPYNLVRSIFDGDSDVSFKILNEDQLKGLDMALSTLTPRERLIIYDYFKRNQTLKQVGEIYNIGTERVRQIVSKAVRKLRHPSRGRLIRYGLQGADLYKWKRDLEFEEIELSKRQKAVDEEKARISANEKTLGIPHDLSQSIDELDLSVRTYNCLFQKNLRSVKAVVEFFEKSDYHSVRNMGITSYKELQEKLSTRFGIAI